jgi:hypothetical protein
VTFEVNGYRLSHLVKDPAAVQRSLADLVKVLADTGEYLASLGRTDLTARLNHLADQLEARGESIDDAFHDAFIAVTGEAEDACVEAAGPDGMRSPNDKNSDIYRALGWSIADLVVVRIGGYGTIEHPSGRSG